MPTLNFQNQFTKLPKYIVIPQKEPKSSWLVLQILDAKLRVKSANWCWKKNLYLLKESPFTTTWVRIKYLLSSLLFYVIIFIARYGFIGRCICPSGFAQLQKTFRSKSAIVQGRKSLVNIYSHDLLLISRFLGCFIKCTYVF